ncbi:hypothetical protein R75461_07795 [Paraburkholderia nemoris]|uniref:restriction endonuclease n=1 Tax=Paraburkholderia nemoris TaxID=2793076 RepID=UPI00190A4ABE|nr:restriction endonuclease [Paraburkholderia nemoris]MBK3786506.1 hypothetical protein [Paraburkholderia aspalathi]CAE6857486.1 hypothetical protein R75461_07795 [Paraburkholderia nemoris]
MARRGFVSSINRLSREMERSARAHQRHIESQQRAQMRAVREAERAQRAYERDQLADEKERKRLYAESRLAEVESQNEQLEQVLQSLDRILIDGLHRSAVIDLTKLRVEPESPQLDLGSLAHPAASPQWSEPQKPSAIAGILPWVRRSYEQRLSAAKNAFAIAEQQFRDAEAQRQFAIQKQRDKHKLAVDAAKKKAEEHNETIRQFEQALSEREPEAVASYFALVIGSSPYPDGFPQAAVAQYQPESKQLIVAYDLPGYENLIPVQKNFKYVKSSDTVTESLRPESQRRATYASVVAQTVLRSLHEIYSADIAEHVDTVVFNGFVDAIDRGTGKKVRPCIVTVRTSRDTFHDVDLEHVEPAACLKTLNASVSKSAAELAPVRPILELNMSDPRFIIEDDVLSKLDQRSNLMDLSPGEFESLITNLFQAMGLETRLTQASRDGGSIAWRSIRDRFSVVRSSSKPSVTRTRSE